MQEGEELKVNMMKVGPNECMEGVTLMNIEINEHRNEHRGLI